MTGLRAVVPAVLLTLLCACSARAQGGAVERGQLTLEAQAVHLGDGQYSDSDPPVTQGKYVGGTWQVSFTCDRPLKGSILVLDDVSGVNGDMRASIRLSGAGQPVNDGEFLGHVDYRHNNDRVVSRSFGVNAAGTYTLSVTCTEIRYSTNPQGTSWGRQEYTGLDDFTFRRATLLYEPPDAVVTLPGQAAQVPDDGNRELVLTSSTLHLGDRQFSEIDPPPTADATFSGWARAFVFSIDRPIQAFAMVHNVADIGEMSFVSTWLAEYTGDVRHALEASAHILGHMEITDNGRGWFSPTFRLHQPGTYVLMIATRPVDGYGFDDFTCGPVLLNYEPGDAVVTLVGQKEVHRSDTEQRPDPVPPDNTPGPLDGTTIDGIPPGQAALWADTWHVAHTGSGITCLRADGAAAVEIPFSAASSPTILGSNGTQWVVPPAGVQAWQQVTGTHLPFAMAARTRVTGRLSDLPAVVGGWRVGFYSELDDRGVVSARWMVFQNGGKGFDEAERLIWLSDQGTIKYADVLVGQEPLDFTR